MAELGVFGGDALAAGRERIECPRMGGFADAYLFGVGFGQSSRFQVETRYIFVYLVPGLCLQIGEQLFELCAAIGAECLEAFRLLSGRFKARAGLGGLGRPWTRARSSTFEIGHGMSAYAHRYCTMPK
jgi:hypothetical protein